MKFPNLKSWLKSSFHAQYELDRYDLNLNIPNLATVDAEYVRLYDPSNWLSKPYVTAESILARVLKRDSEVLEFGCGYGLHTRTIAKYTNHITLVDPSSKALLLQSEYFSSREHLVEFNHCSLEELSHNKAKYDLIVSYGAISYVSPVFLRNELLQLLAPGGSILLVDSLNNNPVLIINRLFRVMLGQRGFTQTRRLMNISQLHEYGTLFSSYCISYHDKLTPLVPCLNLFRGNYCLYESLLSSLRRLDRRLPRWLSFKFVALYTL